MSGVSQDLWFLIFAALTPMHSHENGVISVHFNRAACEAAASNVRHHTQAFAPSRLQSVYCVHREVEFTDDEWSGKAKQ